MAGSGASLPSLLPLFRASMDWVADAVGVLSLAASFLVDGDATNVSIDKGWSLGQWSSCLGSAVLWATYATWLLQSAGQHPVFPTGALGFSQEGL